MRPSAFLRANGDPPLVVGHRGGRGPSWPPENTLAAFEEAARQGARAVELDARAGADGEAVVMHDPTLARLTAGRDVRSVASLSSGELAGVALGENEASEHRAPTLAAVLAWAEERRIAVNVELKHDVPSKLGLARAAARAIAAARADVLVSSFDPALLIALAAFAPRVPRALLTYAGQGRAVEVVRALVFPGLVHALHVQRTETPPSAVAGWKRRGLHVGVWTVNDPREARELVALGVDFLITDDPAGICEALAATTTR